MSPSNEPSFLGLPIKISNQIPGYLLPDRDVIKIDTTLADQDLWYQEVINHDASDQDLLDQDLLTNRPTLYKSYCYDNDSCHPRILQISR